MLSIDFPHTSRGLFSHSTFCLFPNAARNRNKRLSPCLIKQNKNAGSSIDHMASIGFGLINECIGVHLIFPQVRSRRPHSCWANSPNQSNGFARSSPVREIQNWIGAYRSIPPASIRSLTSSIYRDHVPPIAKQLAAESNASPSSGLH